MSTEPETATLPPICCITAQGFKHFDATLKRFVLLGKGQEITLSAEEFAALAEKGLVHRADEVAKAVASEDAARIDLLRKHFRRPEGAEVTRAELDQYAHLSLEKMTKLLDDQAKSQAQWEAEKAQRLQDKLAREEAAAQEAADRHTRQSDLAKSRAQKARQRQDRV